MIYISESLILLHIWIWDKFSYIAPNRLYITSHNDQLPTAPLAIRYIRKNTITFTIMIILKVLVCSSCLFIQCFLIYTDGNMSIIPSRHLHMF